jgi:hypothetical protein
MTYRIEHRISTLAENTGSDSGNPDSFLFADLRFQQWEYNIAHGWLGDSWVIAGKIEAPDYAAAINLFRTKLFEIVPKISFISQCYCDFVTQSYLVTREGSEIAFVQHIKETKPVPLSFTDAEQKALYVLYDNTQIPKEFYYYWNEAVNSTGYTSSLFMMFSAIETLYKTGGKKDWKKLEDILGVELKEELFKPNNGLRHRLTHGEYYRKGDHDKNYLDIVHNKIIQYFNKEIFKELLLSEDIVSPQRNFHGNTSVSHIFMQPKNGALLNLRDVLSELDKNDINNLENYDLVRDQLQRRSF